MPAGPIPHVGGKGDGGKGSRGVNNGPKGKMPGFPLSLADIPQYATPPTIAWATRQSAAELKKAPVDKLQSLQVSCKQSLQHSSNPSHTHTHCHMFTHTHKNTRNLLQNTNTSTHTHAHGTSDKA